MFLQIFTVSVFCSILSHVYSDPPICGGDINVDENGGNITSPNYPKHYPSRTRCEWVLTAPDNMQVILKFLSFQLEDDTQTRNTCVDYVEIRDGGRANSPILGSYCGNESLHEVRSTRNELSVRFTSDYSREYKGFLATYSSGNPNATIGIQGPLKGSLFDNIHATAAQGKDLILHLGSSEWYIADKTKDITEDMQKFAIDTVNLGFAKNNPNSYSNSYSPMAQYIRTAFKEKYPRSNWICAVGKSVDFGLAYATTTSMSLKKNDLQVNIWRPQ